MLPVFTEMACCHGYTATKVMAVEVDTDKYYFERILKTQYRTAYVIIRGLLERYRFITGKFVTVITSGPIKFYDLVISRQNEISIDIYSTYALNDRW